VPKDRRFTKVGEFLRRRSWDELPQLLKYLKNWSLALDLKIIAKTALLLLHDRNAY
jgi:lipopolysaccharide/colanic/teichoic acid biosynthesis glycosyltransferase